MWLMTAVDRWNRILPWLGNKMDNLLKLRFELNVLF